MRVVPDVTGLDKSFDYLVPDNLGPVEIGDVVRFELHGRRGRGWVVAAPDSTAVPAERLRPLTKRSGAGPSAELIDLAQWASVRWAAGRLRPFLVSATPTHNVAARPAGVAAPVSSKPTAVSTVRLAPSEDPLPTVLDAAAGCAGQLLVIHPSVGGAAAVARRLTKAGQRVALWPDQWLAAADGADIVVGTRTAAWARLAELGGVVILDEHDEALQDERAPTWHGRDVLLERCRRWGAPCTLVSPVPTVVALAASTTVRATPTAIDWPVVQIIDRSDVEPWKRKQLSSEVIAALRHAGSRVLCVTNTPGRSRLLACRSCTSLLRCTTCGATVHQADDDTLSCARCATQRPAICQVCASTALANIRPGVRRLAEELSAAANRPVVSITKDIGEIPPAEVYVGTEAALHRLGRVDVVAFLDIDAELLAPRYRAAEEALVLLMRGARMVGRRADGGRVLVQTRLPDHPVLRAAALGDPSMFTAGEIEIRGQLGFPPFGALARLSGSEARPAAAALGADGRVQIGIDGDNALVRAADWTTLAAALGDLPRRPGLRIEVDPPR